MIRIDISKISEWDNIKQRHMNFIKSIIENNKQKMNELPETVKLYIENNKEDLFVGEREVMIKSANELRSIIFGNINELELNILDKFYYTNKKKKVSIIEEINNTFTDFKYEEVKKEVITNIDKVYKNDDEIKIKKRKEFIEKYYSKYINGFIINDLLKKLFNYSKLTRGINGWDRHKLISKMKIEVCPYCNRNYISNYKENNKKKTTADLDHFYPKSIYPILALSLYNFIPSCQICNSRFKLDLDFYSIQHIYPYEESFDGYGYNFRTYPSNDMDIGYLKGESNNFELKIECSDASSYDDKVENSKHTFKLEELYNSHRGYVQEIIKKANLYNDDRISTIKNEFESLFDSKKEVFQLIFSNYIEEDDLLKKPLSKLTKDICNEFGIDIGNIEE